MQKETLSRRQFLTAVTSAAAFAAYKTNSISILFDRYHPRSSVENFLPGMLDTLAESHNLEWEYATSFLHDFLSAQLECPIPPYLNKISTRVNIARDNNNIISGLEFIRTNDGFSIATFPYKNSGSIWGTNNSEEAAENTYKFISSMDDILSDQSSLSINAIYNPIIIDKQLFENQGINYNLLANQYICDSFRYIKFAQNYRDPKTHQIIAFPMKYKLHSVSAIDKQEIDPLMLSTYLPKGISISSRMSIKDSLSGTQNWQSFSYVVNPNQPGQTYSGTESECQFILDHISNMFHQSV